MADKVLPRSGNCHRAPSGRLCTDHDGPSGNSDRADGAYTPRTSAGCADMPTADGADDKVLPKA